MNPNQAAQILAFCAQAWPTMTVGERATEVWAQALAGTDAHHAQAAVREMVKTDEYPPTVSRIISAARGLARGHDEYRALSAARADGHQAAKAMAALNALYAQYDRPAHDHRRGREACPCCTTSADRLKLFAHDAADLLADYGIQIDPDRAARYATQGQPG